MPQSGQKLQQPSIAGFTSCRPCPASATRLSGRALPLQIRQILERTHEPHSSSSPGLQTNMTMYCGMQGGCSAWKEDIREARAEAGCHEPPASPARHPEQGRPLEAEWLREGTAEQCSDNLTSAQSCTSFRAGLLSVSGSWQLQLTIALPVS